MTPEKLIHREYVMGYLLVLRSELVAVLRPPKKSRSMSRLKGSQTDQMRNGEGGSAKTSGNADKHD